MKIKLINSMMAVLLMAAASSCISHYENNIEIKEPDPPTVPEPPTPEEDDKDEYLVGAEYFAGFYDNSPKYNYYGPGEKSWLPDFPERKPINKAGIYTNQESMYYDIEDASNYGVDFFSILWYPNPENSAGGGAKEINKAIDWFVNSPNCHKMKFMIEIVNGTNFSVSSAEQWNDIAIMCSNYMKHSSYLKIDGRPVIKIFAASAFVDGLGNSETTANEVLNSIRQEIINAGLENPIIAIGMNGPDKIKDSKFKNLTCDLVMQYMDEGHYIYEYVPEGIEFDLLTDIAIADMESRKDDSLPYVPFISVGWDGRPWNYHITSPDNPKPRPSYKMPTAEQWKNALLRTKTELDENTNLGFPKKDGSRQKAFTIYAWNEFGEGGFLAPTEILYYMKLEQVKEVFGNK